MDAQALLGYSAALAIGAVLGVIGGGGAILALPVLVYAFSIPGLEATTYSLFIVGLTSAVGSVQYARSKSIDYKAALRFALPAFVVIYAVRAVVLPRLPTELALPGGVALTKDSAIMFLLAAVMVASGITMILKSKDDASAANASERKRPSSVVSSIARGAAVGLLTGFVGAGGGFMLVPALVLSEHLRMKTAVGTSLLIIAANSLFGFARDAAALSISFDWRLMLGFSALAVAGMLFGSRLARRLSDGAVKTFFGWFVLVFSGVIVAIEVLR